MVILVVTGLWVLIGCAEAAHLVTILTDRSLQTYTVLCVPCILAGLLVYAGILLLLRKKGVLRIHQKKEKASKGFSLLFLFLTAVTVILFLRDYSPILQEATYEIVLGNVAQGRLMSVHPFLGTGAESGMPFRQEILGLSSFYSCLITISKQSPYIMLCRVIPMAVWICAMLVYKAFAEKLFPASGDKQWMFLCFVAFVFLVTMNSEGMPGQRLFYAGFSGETIRGVVLLPYAVYAGWQRKWLLGVLAVLAEACLVWTTYGIGYCAVAVGCMLIIHLWTDRRCKDAT